MTASCPSPPSFEPPLALRWVAPTRLSPAQHLALDHALLEAADRGEPTAEVLRVWEPEAPMVVLGRSSRHTQEVNLDACRADGVAVLRRVSGGATILTGPGCLMYALLLNLEARPELRAVDHAHVTVLAALAAALHPVAPGARCAGTSDLVVKRDNGLLKFSGNSLRVGRRWLLYHGTLMYGLDPALVARYLREPPRQPEYRGRRRHQQFVTNLQTDRQTLLTLLRDAFNAEEELSRPPIGLTAELVSSHYSREEWNLSR